MNNHFWFAAILTATLTALIHIKRSHEHLVEHLDRQTHRIQGVIKVSTQDAVNELTAVIKKGTSEVVAKITDLQEQVDAGEPVDLTELAAAAKALDDIVPDLAAADVLDNDPPF